MNHPRADGPRVLVIVQNLPVPLDRRVWLECQALTSQGYHVSVICPKGPGDPRRQRIGGISIYKYTPAPEAKGLFGFAVEFGYSWVRTALLSLTVYRREGFDVIQACNPPDTYWLLARLWRSKSVRFVFDQHDLNPELFLSRFGRPRSVSQRAQFKILRWLEQMTYRSADHVITTNESYRSIALTRGRRTPETVSVVRSGPDTRVMRPIHPAIDDSFGSGPLLAYLGVMGPQDSVDTIIDLMDELVHHRGRSDIRAVLMGFGDCLEDLKRETAERGLGSHIHFTGRVGPAEISNFLSAAQVGLSPDQKTPLNDVSTMNKTMEYMAYALPSVSFDLAETRVSAGSTALYVTSGDVTGFSDAVETLLNDPDQRIALGRAARERVSTVLDWQEQARAYVRVFDEVVGRPLENRRLDAWPHVAGVPARAAPATRWVDLTNEREYSEFLRTRGR